jgi:hypothetical protein
VRAFSLVEKEHEMETCEVDGVVYVSSPESAAGNCVGCAADDDQELCNDLPMTCVGQRIVWVVTDKDYTQAAHKMSEGGHFATAIVEAYMVADSGNRRKLVVAFKDLFGRYSV